ncbi:MAG: cell division protein FtsZ [Holosporales bacterium]|jgi:cell division protein FtsZ|nr:cell division protein FtsZ [Holosporales bacterium]
MTREQEMPKGNFTEKKVASITPSVSSQPISEPTLVPENLRPRITVMGVGGAGGNAVNNMIRLKLEGVDFVVANTDAQALAQSLAENRIQLGSNVTRGLGAGSRPDVGRASAEEVLDEIQGYLHQSDMVFVTAGMGGGTGTGAAPVVAQLAREQGILTIGVVTKPFHFEGTHRMRTAEKGIEELQQYVDTLIIIPNQNLFRVADEKTTFASAFKKADDVLGAAVRGVTDLMVMPGLINLDFADIRSVMREQGKAMMGSGSATGERRALDAAEAAISNPLLDDVSMKGALSVLINVTGGLDMTLYEVDEAANRIREEVDPEANIIFGAIFDENANGTVTVSVVATGIDGGGTRSRLVANRSDSAKEVSSVVGEKGSFTTPMSAVSSDEWINSSPTTGINTLEQVSEKEDNSVSAEEKISVPLLSEIQKEEPKRKSLSLFERLTGMRRQSSAPQVSNKTFPEKLSVDKEVLVKPEDDLDIPAFLRRK